MNSKKTVSIGFIVILLTSLAALLPTVRAAAPNWMMVVPQPPEIFLDNSHLRTGETFKINVTFSVTNLYGFEYKLAWNRTLLQCTVKTVHVPSVWYDPENNNYTIVKNVIQSNATHYWHWLSISALAPAPVFTGNWTICEYTMTILYHPEVPEPNGKTPFKFFDDKMSDDHVNPILHSLYDGQYEIEAIIPPPPPTPHIEVVDPIDLDDEFNEGYPPPFSVGEHFNATVCIYDLVAKHNLWGWQVTLSFNDTHLDLVHTYEGNLLPDNAGDNGTWFKAWVYPGYVTMVGLFLGEHTKPVSPAYKSPPYNPGGVLAIVEFEVTYEAPAAPPESSDLTLYDTKLADTTENPPPVGIIHEVSNATYYTPYKVTGRNIDCFTDPYRKYGYKHYTGYIGMGPNMNADAYEPQDWVTIYSLVTYNNAPVQNKLVEYEITPMDKMTGEEREVEGFPLYRTTMTNASGIATLEFRIPWPCDDPERVLGGWRCFQKVDIACQSVNDTLWFEVGWTIWLQEVSVVNAKKCTYANVTITYKNIAIGPFFDGAIPIYEQTCTGPEFRGYEYDTQQPPREWKHVYFTVVIYDDLGVPIGKATEEIDVPTGYWCHPEPGSYMFQIHIPKWAFLGIGTVYVNAYTDVPSLCGIPYCPEISITFPITIQ